MDKVTKQRDPNRQAAGRKGHEKYMAKLKEDILKNVGNGGSSSSSNSSITTNDSTNGGSDTTSTTTSSGSTITNFSYIHGVGAIAVFPLGVCIFVITKLMTNQTASRPDKGPKRISKIRRKML